MKIYTKRGDGGETSLFRDGRVSKDSIRVEAYGTVDELNSIIGWVRSANTNTATDKLLAKIQNDLFIIGSDLASPQDSVKKGDQVLRLGKNAQLFLEEAIDEMESDLTPLKHFILPGGTPAASCVHVARAVCRRAERRIVALAQSEEVNPAITIYMNRLSDFLFVTARYMNKLANVPDRAWEKKLS